MSSSDSTTQESRFTQKNIVMNVFNTVRLLPHPVAMENEANIRHLSTSRLSSALKPKAKNERRRAQCEVGERCFRSSSR